MTAKNAARASLLGKFRQQFFAGLVIFVPLSLSIYFFHLFFLLISQTLFPLLNTQRWFTIPQSAVRPLSFILTLLMIWSVGVVASNFIGKRFVSWMEWIIRRIPFFRGFYEAIQKVTEAFFCSKPLYRSVVLVEYPRRGVYTFGFVTSQMSGKVFHSAETYLCVFIPTVPNPTSGVLLYAPQSETIAIDLTMEEAVKILISHGVVPIEDRMARPKDKE